MLANIPLNRKGLFLIREAMNQRIVSEEERYTREDSGDDAAGDFDNDLHYLRILRDDFSAQLDNGPWVSKIYECWRDDAQHMVMLLPLHNVSANRESGQLPETASLQYRFVADTGEEAAAIHALRQGWGAYTPAGEPAKCMTCDAHYYPLGYGDCWRCGHLG